MCDVICYFFGFGFGVFFIVFFVCVVGGIYIKVVDVGVDFVGKVEVNILEDDFCNLVMVVDNVGDNVGDVVGMGVDFFEFFCGFIIVCVAFFNNFREMVLSFWIFGFGIFVVIIGFWIVFMKDDVF